MGDAAFKTVTTGATVYVLGQAAKAIFVDPIMEQRKVIGEITYNLMYLAPWYANPVVHDETPPEQREPYDKAADTLRQCASRLEATMAAIAWYGFWELTTWVPPRSRVRKAVGSLILLSNSMYRIKGVVEPEKAEKGERPSDVRNDVKTLLWLEGRPLFWPYLWRALKERWNARTAKRPAAG